MGRKNIISGAAVACGVVLLAASFYVTHKINEIKGGLSGAQKLTNSPVTKVPGIGMAAGKVTAPAQGAMDKASAYVDRYAKIAFWVGIGGGLLILVGGGIYYTGRKEQE